MILRNDVNYKLLKTSLPCERALHYFPFENPSELPARGVRFEAARSAHGVRDSALRSERVREPFHRAGARPFVRRCVRHRVPRKQIHVTPPAHFLSQNFRREHGETAVLELLDLEFLEVTGLGEAEGVEAATGGHVADGEFFAYDGF